MIGSSKTIRLPSFEKMFLDLTSGVKAVQLFGLACHVSRIFPTHYASVLLQKTNMPAPCLIIFLPFVSSFSMRKSALDDASCIGYSSAAQAPAALVALTSEAGRFLSVEKSSLNFETCFHFFSLHWIHLKFTRRIYISLPTERSLRPWSCNDRTTTSRLVLNFRDMFTKKFAETEGPGTLLNQNESRGKLSDTSPTLAPPTSKSVSP